MASLSKTGKIDLINIGLLLFSCLLAFVIPFELFLFVYAVLGPLHYLTEISWLHDKNYYAQSKRDVILLVVISLFLTFLFISGEYFPDVKEHFVFYDDSTWFTSSLTFIALGSALFIAFIKKPIIRFIGIVLTCLSVLLIHHSIIFFTVFLPTLVHVFLFTSLFMLYGALRSRSKLGLLTVLLHIACPFLLFYLFPGETFFGTSAGIEVYDDSTFRGVNFQIMNDYFYNAEYEGMSFEEITYQSQAGIAIMRFIAFAYTYHYLNWFSKTEVIRWHKVPKSRFAVVIAAWVVSVVLYYIDYTLGFQWLFLLSFMHVLLEFPLNYVSVVGIFQELKIRILKPTT
jgi:hypothetical protein